MKRTWTLTLRLLCLQTPCPTWSLCFCVWLVSAVSRLMVSGMSRTLRSLWSGHGTARHPDIGEELGGSCVHSPQHPLRSPDVPDQRPVKSHVILKHTQLGSKLLSESIGFTIVVMSTTLDVFSYIKSVGVNVQIFIHETEFLEQVFTYSHTFTKVPSSLSSLTLYLNTQCHHHCEPLILLAADPLTLGPGEAEDVWMITRSWHCAPCLAPVSLCSSLSAAQCSSQQPSPFMNIKSFIA